MQYITPISGFNFANSFLPVHLIYSCQNKEDFTPCEVFRFISSSRNEKRFSNTQESLKLMEELTISYVEKERDMLNLQSYS